MYIGKRPIIRKPSDIINDGMQLTYNSGDSYIRSYPEFLKFFKNQEIITEHSFIIGINFTYGWMPTIFEFKSNQFDLTVNILNKVKKGALPTIDELNILKGMINNSLVGTSKILHFINPLLIPIWDSRVYKYLTGRISREATIGNPNHLLEYVNFCTIVTSDINFEKLKFHVESIIGYEMSPLRVVEIIMYINGK